MRFANVFTLIFENLAQLKLSYSSQSQTSHVHNVNDFLFIQLEATMVLSCDVTLLKI